MSSLDQAFAKVYRQQGVAATSAPTQRTATASLPLRGKADHGISVDELYESSASRSAPSDLDAAHARVRAPHASFAPAGPRTSTEPPLPEIVAAPPAAAPKAAPRLPKTTPAVREGATLRAVFEAPRFRWPEITRILVGAAGAGLDALCRDLTSAAKIGKKVVAVTGRRRGEGRTAVALAIARRLCEQRVRIALVDADFENPCLADRLGVLPQIGWEDVLGGRQPLAEALVESLADGLTLLPLRYPLANLASPEERSRLKSSLTALAENFDLVIVDAAPIDSQSTRIGAEALAAQGRVDRALVLHDLRLTSDDEIEDAGRRLAAAGVDPWEVVENFVPHGENR